MDAIITAAFKLVLFQVKQRDTIKAVTRRELLHQPLGAKRAWQHLIASCLIDPIDKTNCYRYIENCYKLAPVWAPATMRWAIPLLKTVMLPINIWYLKVTEVTKFIHQLYQCWGDYGR